MASPAEDVAGLICLSSGGIDIEVDPIGAAIRQITVRGQQVLYKSRGLGSRLVQESYDSTRNEWLESWHGGWDEIVPNPGAPRVMNGKPAGFHGSVSQELWTLDALRRTSIDMSYARSGEMSLQRRIQMDPTRGSVTVESTITADNPLEYGWCQHIIFSLTNDQSVTLGDSAPDSEIGAALRTARRILEGFWSIDAPQQVLIVGPQMATVRLTWSRAVWPFLWIWVGADFDRRFVGLEPSSRERPDVPSVDRRLASGEQAAGAVAIDLSIDHD